MLFASEDMRLAAVAVAAASRCGSGWLETHAVRGDALADLALHDFDLIVVFDAVSSGALESLRMRLDETLPPSRFYACESDGEVVARVDGMVNGMRMLARADS